MGNYVLKACDVINLLSLADGIANSYSYCVNVTDVMVTGVRCYQHLIVIGYLVADVMEPCGCQQVTIVLMLWTLI